MMSFQSAVVSLLLLSTIVLPILLSHYHRASGSSVSLVVDAFSTTTTSALQQQRQRSLSLIRTRRRRPFLTAVRARDPASPSSRRRATVSSVNEEQHSNVNVDGGDTSSSSSNDEHLSLFNYEDMNRGETAGAVLLVEDVDVYRGAEPILRGIDWRVERAEKWAVVGANGAGKSSLLKAIVGELPCDGNICVAHKEKVGYLQQTAVAGSQRSIFDEAALGMTAINQAQQAIDRANTSGDAAALDQAMAQFEAVGGYQQEQKVFSVLKGLGFSAEDIKTVHCDELSGGWQMRVAFARLLLSEPSLALLDEPGNHLDSAAKTWLANYLANYDGPGAMVLVTHDVGLLSSMDHIAEVVPRVESGSLQTYKSCNYQQYLDLKEQRAAAAVAEYERNVDKAEKLQAFVDRFGASATKAKSAQSRVKQLDRMRRDGLLDLPAQAVITTRFKPTLNLPPAPRAIGEDLVALHNADVGYETGNALVSNVNLVIKKGMKLVVRGPNGSGKSTILQSLRGSLPLLCGDRDENEGLRIGMFNQDFAQQLDPDARALDLVLDYARTGHDGDINVSEQDARETMGRLGLGDDKPLRRIRDLSGGEKARTALSMFALKPSNLLALDEPSNHLDQECVEALSEALGDWGEDGAIVVISHDRAFSEKIEFTHVATVENGRLTLEQRAIKQGDWHVGGLGATQQANGAADASSSKNGDAELDAKLRKQAYNAPKRITKLESLIESTEEKVAVLDEEMMKHGSDTEKLGELYKEKEVLEQKVADYMDEWEQLEELLAQVSN